MYTSLGIFNLFILSFGAGASLIIDLFLITSLKCHRLTKYEFGALRRLSIIAFFGGVLGAVTEIFLLSYQLREGILEGEFASLIVVLFSAIVVLTSITIRNVHLKNLERYQKRHNHLSDNFIEHSGGLSQTATISLITWASIICVKAYALYGTNVFGGGEVDKSYGFLIYLIAIIIGPFLATHFKRLHR